MSNDSKRSHEYELGHTDRELKRLGTQAQLVWLIPLSQVALDVVC
jgi:hypothetical protein